MAYFAKNSSVLDYQNKMGRLCVPFAIVHNATPANKTNSNDLPVVFTLALEGQTAAAAAIDAGTNFTAPVDANGIFGVLISGLGTVSKLLKYDVVGLSSGTVAVSAKGSSTTGVTASGNIAISVDWDGSLAATDLSGVVCVDYIISKN